MRTGRIATVCAVAAHVFIAARGADVKTFDVPSAAMGETVKVSVVTPASYAAGGTARYPVVYLLHGAGNDHTTYLQPFLLDGVDKWRFIAVVPDGKLDWWMDSPLLPKVRRETFVVNELVPWVDSEFRTLPQRQRRAVAGHSMGGQGAMRLGMRHADVFGIVGNVMGGVDICAAANRKELVRLLGPYAENEARWRSFSVLAEAERLRPGALRLFSIVGTEDFFLKPNRDLHELLSKRHIAHGDRGLFPEAEPRPARTAVQTSHRPRIHGGARRDGGDVETHAAVRVLGARASLRAVRGVLRGEGRRAAGAGTACEGGRRGSRLRRRGGVACSWKTAVPAPNK